MKSVKNPGTVEAKEIRFAPSKKMVQSASMWRLWVQGNDVYAVVRNAGTDLKVSIHESGQIHVKKGICPQQILARAINWGDNWEMALEIRFLLSEGTFRPEPEMKKNGKVYFVDIEDDHYVCLNILLTKHEGVDPCQLSQKMSGASIIWKRTLNNRKTVLLAARVAKMDTINLDAINHVRKVLNPKISFTGIPPKNLYVETMSYHWGPGGNTVLIIPMGKEAWPHLGLV